MFNVKVNWSKFVTPYSEIGIKRSLSKPGVYLLWVKLENGKWRCFYVGKARNIKEKLLEHLSPNEQNECIKRYISSYVCGFEFTMITDCQARDEIEKNLFDYYYTECNSISCIK